MMADMTLVLEEPLQVKAPQPSTAIYYPESDGKPVGETDVHIAALFYLWQALRFHFRREEQTYAAGNMLFYYEEGNPAEYKVPDVFVVKGIAKHDRRTYKLWEEKVAPCCIFEITSRSTRLEDLGTKRALYEMLGVREYFLFDPLDEYLRPRLQGYRLDKGLYHPVRLSADGTLTSQELGLVLQPAGRLLKLVDPTTGEAIPTFDEAADLIDEALERVEEATTRAEAEAKRAEAEAKRAEAEAKRAEAAEARAAALATEIERLRRLSGDG